MEHSLPCYVKDAAEWLPNRNRCCFAGRVLEVKLAYGLTGDRREAAVLDAILGSCTSTAQELVVQGAGAARGEGAGPLAPYDDNGNGRITCKEARRQDCARSRGAMAYTRARAGPPNPTVATAGCRRGLWESETRAPGRTPANLR